MNGDPDTIAGITDICDNICYAFGDICADNNWWTEDAMLCIAEAAYQAGLRDA